MTTAGRQEGSEVSGGTTASVQEAMERLGIRGDLLDRVLSTVRRNPILILLATLALGAIFGRRTRGGMRVLRRDVNIAVNRTQATLLGTLLTIIAGLRRIFRSRSRMASSRWMFSRGHSRPMTKAIRHIRNRFGFGPRMTFTTRLSRGGLF